MTYRRRDWTPALTVSVNLTPLYFVRTSNKGIWGTMLPPCVSLKSGVGGTSSVRYKKFKSFSSRFHPALSAEVAVASTSASSRFVRCVFLDSVSTRIEPWKTSWIMDEPGRFVPPKSRWSWLRSQPYVVTGRGDGGMVASSHEDVIAAT